MNAKILVTGSTGVLGTALAPTLTNRDVVSLGYRQTPTTGGSVVFGDVSLENLGLAPKEYARLCDTTDVVLHCASEVNFNAGREVMQAVNVAGAQRIAQFGVNSGAHIVYVSTAFVHRAEVLVCDGALRIDPSAYTESKRIAEDYLRNSAIQLSIVRPSIIVGDSATGSISRYQGIHRFIQAALKNRIPFIPAGSESYVDMVPQDIVADVLVALADGDLPPGDYWVTAGSKAKTVESLLEILFDEARRSSIDMAPMRIMDPAVIDRLMRPAFFDQVPADAVMRLENLTAMCKSLFTGEQFPSTLPELDQQVPIGTRTDADTCWLSAIRTVIAGMAQSEAIMGLGK
jgi:nucleoside-diphosphate-sugar epimerase